MPIEFLPIGASKQLTLLRLSQADDVLIAPSNLFTCALWGTRPSMNWANRPILPSVVVVVDIVFDMALMSE